MKSIVRGALAVALLGSVAVPAFAADLALTQPSPKAPELTAPAISPSFDPFLVRLRALGVVPQGHGAELYGAALVGSTLSNNVVPEVDFTYFFTKNWAVEVIAGLDHSRLTAPASVDAIGGVAPHVGVANTTLLPATVTLQYHLPAGAFDPYVGAGVNYTWFLNTRSPLAAGLGSPDDVVNVHPAAGLALQTGFDYYLTRNWTLNLDVKKVFLETDANIGGSGIGGLSGSDVVRVPVNPWLFGLGVGYRFGASDLHL
jgi:outer membrane protein